MNFLMKEKYYDRIKDQIESLEKSIQHNKAADLALHAEDIKTLLMDEIVSRYYYDKGAIEASFKYDLVVKAAVEVLENEEKYQRILK